MCCLLTACCQPPAPLAEPADLYEDYTSKPNGAHPPTFDSGQRAILTYTPDETATPTILDGSSVIGYRGAHRAAGYATGYLGATAAFIEADWNFGPAGSTDGGQLALCMFASPPPDGFLGDTPVPDSPAHVVFLADRFEYGVWEHEKLTVVADVAYGRTLATEPQHVAVFVRKDLGQAWVLAPTGTIHGPYTHPAISSTSAPYVTAEQFYGNAATDSRVQIQRWHATSTPPQVPTSAAG
ncbi:hypothetical protein A5727_13525 [Mycobacterium sp. ACS4331]|nr:hypothetical protein A5727_13525 [Mycobacterium sp. ACS4331]